MPTELRESRFKLGEKIFCPFQLNFKASSEKILDNTSFNFRKVKESLQQLPMS